MPRGDRTGPRGMGPRTGRAMGYCTGHDAPGYMWPGPGMGLGRGFGMGFGRGPGRGFGRGFGRGVGYPYPMGDPWYGSTTPPQPTPEDELQMLKEEAAALTREQKAVAKRIAELEKKS